jgi:hypothetical protein
LNLYKEFEKSIGFDDFCLIKNIEFDVPPRFNQKINEKMGIYLANFEGFFKDVWSAGCKKSYKRVRKELNQEKYWNQDEKNNLWYAFQKGSFKGLYRKQQEKFLRNFFTKNLAFIKGSEFLSGDLL